MLAYVTMQLLCLSEVFAAFSNMNWCLDACSFITFIPLPACFPSMKGQRRKIAAKYFAILKNKNRCCSQLFFLTRFNDSKQHLGENAKGPCEMLYFHMKWLISCGYAWLRGWGWVAELQAPQYAPSALDSAPNIAHSAILH